MAHFFECLADGEGVGHVEERGAKFGFRGRGKDHFHDCAVDFDGTVERGQGVSLVDRLVRVGRCGAQAETASKAAAGFGFRQVRRIAVDAKDHVGCTAADDCIRVRGEVIEELIDVFDSSFGWRGLIG